jgi:hypothetical protein
MNFQEWLVKQAEDAPPGAEWESIEEAAEEAWNVAIEEGRNEVGRQLSAARAALWAIANTLDEHEIRSYARNAYEETQMPKP